jgi:hypothetical protein
MRTTSYETKMSEEITVMRRRVDAATYAIVIVFDRITIIISGGYAGSFFYTS